MKLEWVITAYNILGYCTATGRMAVHLRSNDSRNNGCIWVHAAGIHKEHLSNAQFIDLAAAQTYCERVALNTSFMY